MTNEFKKITQGQYTRYILESDMGGATTTGAIATMPMEVGTIQKRNPVAHAAQKVAKGSGKHKNPKTVIPRKEKHKKPVAEEFNGGEEYNDEVGMIRSDMATVIRKAKELVDILEPMENLPEWAQEKLAQVKGMIVSVTDYIQSQHDQGMISHTMEGLPFTNKKSEPVKNKTLSHDDYEKLRNLAQQSSKMTKTTRAQNEKQPIQYRREIGSEVEDESLGNDFTNFLNQQGIKHRAHGTPDQERQRTADMMAQRSQAQANRPTPTGPSSEERSKLEALLKQLEAQFDPNYQYSDDHNFWAQQKDIAQRIHSIKKRLSQGVAEGFSQADADRNKIKYQKSGRIGHGLGWKKYDDNSELVQDIVNKFDNITRLVQYEEASESTKYKIVERFFKKYGYPFELFNDVIKGIERRIAGETKKFSEQGVAEGRLNEFAPDDGAGGSEDDVLYRYAKMWYNGDDTTQMRIEAALERMGWEIGEDEGGYDNGGVFVVRAGDINGRSYQSWPAEDLSEGVAESWSQKYKNSINCSHPKGFSQKAHCAGKKKHNESMEMEMTCPDCGMCETHGDHMMEIKQRLDAKCWKGKHKEGTKIKGGVRVNNCVPNENINDDYMNSLEAKLNEKIPKNAPVDVYIKDFEKSNAPQFRGKTKEKRRQMAIAASYGAKNPSKKKK